MLVEAYYQDGKLEFTGKFRFKHSRFKVRVELPEEEIAESATAAIGASPALEPVPAQGGYMQGVMQRLHEIRNMALDEAELPELTEKQRQRLEAIKPRRELRGE